MTKRFNAYLGKAGHLAVMAELLVRGWNVAIPEVDIGDDIFVVEDSSGILRRVQVKTAFATPRRNSFSCQYSLSFKNLDNTFSGIPVYYFFIVRENNKWLSPLIIRQDYLRDHFNNQAGSLHGKNIIFYFSFNNGKVTCSGQDFSGYVNDYSDFPAIAH